MVADGPTSAICRLFSCISFSRWVLFFQRLWLWMLSSLLAILFRPTGLEPTRLPGAAWSWKGAVSVVSTSHCPAVARADGSCVWACRVQRRIAKWSQRHWQGACWESSLCIWKPSPRGADLHYSAAETHYPYRIGFSMNWKSFFFLIIFFFFNGLAWSLHRGCGPRMKHLQVLLGNGKCEYVGLGHAL